ncbi:unnamed protein product [Discula destructiva]
MDTFDDDDRLRLIIEEDGAWREKLRKLVSAAEGHLSLARLKEILEDLDLYSASDAEYRDSDFEDHDDKDDGDEDDDVL